MIYYSPPLWVSNLGSTDWQRRPSGVSSVCLSRCRTSPRRPQGEHEAPRVGPARTQPWLAVERRLHISRPAPGSPGEWRDYNSWGNTPCGPPCPFPSFHPPSPRHECGAGRGLLMERSAARVILMSGFIRSCYPDDHGSGFFPPFPSP